MKNQWPSVLRWKDPHARPTPHVRSPGTAGGPRARRAQRSSVHTSPAGLPSATTLLPAVHPALNTFRFPLQEMLSIKASSIHSESHTGPASSLILTAILNQKTLSPTAYSASWTRTVRGTPLILAKGWACRACKASLPLPAELPFDGESNSAPKSQEKKKRTVTLVFSEKHARSDFEETTGSTGCPCIHKSWVQFSLTGTTAERRWQHGARQPHRGTCGGGTGPRPWAAQRLRFRLPPFHQQPQTSYKTHLWSSGSNGKGASLIAPTAHSGSTVHWLQLSCSENLFRAFRTARKGSPSHPGVLHLQIPPSVHREYLREKNSRSLKAKLEIVTCWQLCM